MFEGHEEYVTSHTFDLITAYRNAGGNLAFLSANSFFYRVKVSGNTMTGRTPWRDLGRPEAALIGAQYAGWDEGNYPNRPYHITNTAAAPWLFKGTGLHDGSIVGNYGIEVDEPNSASPPHTQVLARDPERARARQAGRDDDLHPRALHGVRRRRHQLRGQRPLARAVTLLLQSLESSQRRKQRYLGASRPSSWSPRPARSPRVGAAGRGRSRRLRHRHPRR